MGASTATVRPMEARDLPAVLAIESESHPSPWTEKIFVEELAREWARLVVAQIPAGDSSAIVAFCNYWLVADELHLLNICCAAQHRRKGYGMLLMEHLIQVARDRNCRLVTLEVRASNAGAIAMYEQHRFERVGLRSGYYADNGEDAVVMLLHLES